MKEGQTGFDTPEELADCAASLTKEGLVDRLIVLATSRGVHCDDQIDDKSAESLEIFKTEVLKRMPSNIK